MSCGHQAESPVAENGEQTCGGEGDSETSDRGGGEAFKADKSFKTLLLAAAHHLMLWHWN